MKVDVTIKKLTNHQVSHVVVLIPKGVYWRVNSWSDNDANIEITGIEDDALQAIFYELREGVPVSIR